MHISQGSLLWRIKWSQAAVAPGTIAGKDHREGAAGHRDPLHIVLLPTDIWKMEGRSKGGHKEKSGARSATDNKKKETSQRQEQLHRSVWSQEINAGKNT